ncbi:aldo-keto reductase AKR2E4-like isoform X2 [Pieris brassicae]|uniref:aldo-keto reductase AKR2E4-like isoform X2 n=1 Tax=Pieris brassicae TaxID=7116 RepID=UPI001E65E928|nr:aldo-keto reductase AKR2E4-like isoform X2 [Pieris brassicae]
MKVLTCSTLLTLLSASLLVSVDGCKKKLNDGNEIPDFAFGTFKLKTPTQSIRRAIEAGYRLIDTAAFYANEEEIGKGIRDVIERGIVTRAELFISGKSEGENICLDYVKTWRGMENAQKLGLARSIGVSNFNSKQINRILTLCDVPPAVNEIEVNPTYPNLALVAYCKVNNIAVMAYSPFGYMVPRRYDLEDYSPPKFNDPYFVKLAHKYGKKTSQIAMRYLIDRNVIPIPRSDNPTHIQENIDVYDFKLTTKEVSTINTYDINTKVYELGFLRNNVFYSFYQS